MLESTGSLISTNIPTYITSFPGLTIIGRPAAIYTAFRSSYILVSDIIFAAMDTLEGK